MQNFSIELSKRLSELSGHTTGEGYDADGSSLLNMRHYYVDSKDHGIMVVCGHRIKWGEDNDELKVICPAWQVEDLLRNIFKITENFKEKGIWKDGELLFINDIIHEISCFIAFNSFDTACQKIEEYLWVLFDDHAPVSHDDMVIASAYAMRAIKKQPKDEERTGDNYPCI